MEKVDVAIAVAGVVVLATAIAGSALYGGSSISADVVTVEFQEETHELEPQSASGSGPNEVTFTFDVPAFNVTALTFEAVASTAAGSAGAPSLTVTATSPDGQEFGGDGASVTVDWSEAPPAYEGPRSGLPAPDASAQGEWTVTVTASSGAPVTAPYTVEVTGAVTDYHGHVEE